MDPGTRRSWRQRADGSIQALIFSTRNANRIDAGRLLVVDLELDAEAAAFHLVRRRQVFAPREADDAIQLTSYDAPVVALP